MKQTQKQWVVTQLLENKNISRNQALSRYITRLSAIIYDLRKEGWEFNSREIKRNGISDYVYYVMSTPGE
jgi:hypothetical protein